MRETDRYFDGGSEGDRQAHIHTHTRRWDESSNMSGFLLPIEDVAFNQPKFCSSTTWNQNGSTEANSSITGTGPMDVFVDVNNIVHVSRRTPASILAWFQGNTINSTSISTGLNAPFGVFLTSNGALYTDNCYGNASSSEIVQWVINATSWTPVMKVQSICAAHFIDPYDNIYCSIATHHQVIRRLFTDDLNTTIIVAGTGTPGSAPNLLSSPRGIFVSLTMSLYVADCHNNRVQLFRSGQRNGTTVLGNDTIDLNCPNALVLDGNGYLFITDSGNNRIIGSGPDGYRCVAGCSRVNGSALSELSGPHALSFDRFGNLFVADTANDRIQKFALVANSCGEYGEIAYLNLYQYSSWIDSKR